MREVYWEYHWAAVAMRLVGRALARGTTWVFVTLVEALKGIRVEEAGSTMKDSRKGEGPHDGDHNLLMATQCDQGACSKDG